MVAEANEENISVFEIDGIIHYWDQEIKIVVDVALTKWLGDFLDSDEFESIEVDQSEEAIARRHALFAELRKPANDPVFTF